ncbi:hypothetical protein Hdeb2414_s0018g00522601 [Helianthus debilis subsp. tardiflorus]
MLSPFKISIVSGSTNYCERYAKLEDVEAGFPHKDIAHTDPLHLVFASILATIVHGITPIIWTRKGVTDRGEKVSKSD